VLFRSPLNDEIRALTDETARIFHDDVAALGCLTPTREPRATEFVCAPGEATDMIRIIERLVASGHAYVAQGHVLFAVPSMPEYGALSRRSLDEMLAGARVDVAPYKRDPMDFVLWKPSNPETEPGWDSPWGYGRPGWHIECSAMSAALLGEVFDIHGGGIDLVFPHHENEIAQSRCAFGHPLMAQVWMHNGFLQVEGEKMSKSLGNFVTIHELLHTDTFGGRSWPGPVLRLAMLRTHYRQPIDWTVRALEEAEATLEGWAELVDGAPSAPPSPAVIEALADDLNTPAALAELHRLAREARAGDRGAAGAMATSARDLLGLGPDGWPRRAAADGLEPDVKKRIETLVAARLSARREKNWAESDRIRDELAAMGLTLKDGKDPATGEPVTTWEVKR
jgi:cysteinyl-tRNA synthetase